MDARVLLHGPNLERHVVRTRGQQVALRIPLDGVDFVLRVQKEHTDNPVTTIPYQTKS